MWASAPTMGVCTFLDPLVKGDSPVRGNVRNADKGVAVSGEEVDAEGIGGIPMKQPKESLRLSADAEIHGRLSSKCNTFFKENFSRSFPPKTFAWSVVNQIDHEIHIILFNAVEIKPLWKEKA